MNKTKIIFFFITIFLYSVFLGFSYSQLSGKIKVAAFNLMMPLDVYHDYSYMVPSVYLKNVHEIMFSVQLIAPELKHLVKYKQGSLSAWSDAHFDLVVNTENTYKSN